MSKNTAHILLFFASSLWGVNFVSMKFLAGVIPPLSLIFIRFGLAALFLWLLLIIRRKKDPSLIPLEKSDYKMIGFTGFIGVSLYFYFQVFAFEYLTANTASLICALIPIFSLCGEVIAHKKKCSFFIYALCMSSIIGVYFVLNMRVEEFLGSGVAIGVLLMIGSILSWVIFTLITGPLQEKYGSLSSLTFQSTSGAIILGITALFDGKEAYYSIVNHPKIGLIIINLLFIGIGSSALAYLFYIDGMKTVGLQGASLYMNLIPIITALTSYVVFKEALTASQVMGIAIVIGSIIAINKLEQLQEKQKNKTDQLRSVLSK